MQSTTFKGKEDKKNKVNIKLGRLWKTSPNFARIMI